MCTIGSSDGQIRIWSMAAGREMPLSARGRRHAESRLVRETFAIGALECGALAAVNQVGRSEGSLGLFHRNKLTELSKLVKIAESLDADRLIDPAHLDRSKSAGRDELRYGSCGFGIVRRIK